MFRFIFLVALGLSFTAAQNERTARVVGGRNAGLGEAPYQVSLRAFGSTFHFCGGALIGNRWVLTAAACVFGRARNSINAVAGSVSLSANGVARRSTNIITHHLFDPRYIDNNIALVQTAAFPLNQNIWPVTLSSTVLRAEVPAVLSGFGATNIDGGANSDRLQILSLITAPNDEDFCIVDFDMNFCTNNGGGEGFCTSDLGGPLVSNGQLIGIASWNHPCGTGWWDVYARVSHYRLWIGAISGI
ncbi:unnamed protein product [Chironomus riparius]|uniref:Peptidase S1 domain-containing protein n=1 Tax=Chironomus riparius TaxID=315576 RepID=A0A9N9S365_9DIPT|nr:unnamed protein product [Chironomus riparius]